MHGSLGQRMRSKKIQISDMRSGAKHRIRLRPGSLLGGAGRLQAFDFGPKQRNTLAELVERQRAEILAEDMLGRRPGSVIIEEANHRQFSS
ncbi:hypothetical protein CHELA40_10941 [Chelatococcus asaccharovorans]|nr:hypothetical protein CHELA40_10941 [Chelatococcus asaccharovorans]